jgi:putative ABC transport system permease protein
VPNTLVDTLAHVPGVRKVQVDVGGPVVLIGSNGKPVHTGGAPSEGGIWHPVEEAIGTVPSFESGAAPTQPGQIVINSGAARRAKLHTGDHTLVLVPSSGLVPVTISGIYHTDTETGGYVGALFEASQARQLFTDGTHVGAVELAGDGVSQSELRNRVAQLLPADLEAKTGDQVRAETKTDIEKALSFVNYFLLAFGFIALIVGTFIIYNTFSMLVAQRARELALLRAIGADRGQIRRAVLFEAGIVGVIGSVLGIAAGVGLAIGLRAFLDAIDVGLPSGPLDVRPRTIVVGLAVGVLVTLLSANAPSRRAATTPPVAAMRSEFAALGVSLRTRTVLGAIFAGAGAITIAGGLNAGKAGTAASLIGLALLLVGTAALLLSPVLSRLTIGPLGRLLGLPFGAVGRLARTNAVRNPRRTAATAFALTVGLLLVSGVAVLGASATASINAAIDTGVTADYMLTGTDAAPVPPAAVAAARASSGVGSITEISGVEVTIDGKNSSGTGVEGPLPPVAPLTIVAGAEEATGTTMLVADSYAEDHHWRLGQSITLHQPGAGSVTVTVGGIFKKTNLFDSWIVSGEVYRALTPAPRRFDFVALVMAAPGTSLGTLRTNLERAVDPFYIVEVQDKEQFKGEQARQIQGLLAILYGLLGLAIVIAILGIINTLALSVIERRREIGMLRAVGMVRGQLRRTIYVESLLIAVFGAVLGLVLGVAFGALFTHSLRSEGLDHLQIPWGESLLFLVLAALVGVLAALWPASRAARIRPLEVIAEA